MNKEFKKLLEASYTKGFEECARTGHKVGQLDAIFNSIVMGEFAELIVRECLYIARLQRNNMQFLASNPPQSAAAYDIERNIMNHFGVEE
jgi:hypothetical protein